MPDQIPQDFPQPTREQLVDNHCRDVRFYSNGTQATDEGTQPWIDAHVVADQLVPAYLQVKTSADNLVLREATGKAAEAWLAAKGLPGRIPALGAVGYVVITASTGGTHLFVGDEIKLAGKRFRCLREAVYGTGGLNLRVPVQGLDTGPETNLPPGSKGQWTSPRPGCGQDATVWADPDGQGLRGGRNEETDAEIVARVVEAGKNPAGAGNDAQLQRAVKEAGVALGVPVQQAFTTPAILGPSTCGIVFTVLPDKLGGSRLPSGDQVNLIEAYVKSMFPGGDSLFFGMLGDAPTILFWLKVRWASGAAGWVDLTPWPTYLIGQTVKVSAVTDALNFTLARDGGYTGAVDPQPGQTLAFYDKAKGVFRKKRILSVTKVGGSGLPPWQIVCDGTNEASDVSYTPTVNQRPGPWSDSLDSLVAPLLSEFETYGPGEQVASFFDEGRRQKRQPPSPEAWPSVLGARSINGVQDLPAVSDAQLIEPTPNSLPLATTVGVPGSLSYLRSLNALAVYPL